MESSKYRIEFKCDSDNFCNIHSEFQGTYDDAVASVLAHVEMMNDYDENVICLWKILRWSESLECWVRVTQFTMYRHV